MIVLQNVSKGYGNSKKKAVDNLNWEIEDGKITGFIGPNGAGKSTTIKMITGVIAPTTGTITVNGYDIVKESVKAKEQIGYVSDSPDHYLRLTGLEYLNFVADIYGVSKEQRVEFIEGAAKSFEMETALNSKIVSYSHGMRQKIMIMGALIHNPPVWILDEPLSGLDPQSAFVLKDMMRRHCEKGNIVLFSTHVLEVAEKLCDRVVIMRKGTQIFCGTLEQLTNRHPDKSLEEIFLELIEIPEGTEE